MSLDKGIKHVTQAQSHLTRSSSYKEPMGTKSTTATFTLFCLVEGDNPNDNAFPVKIDNNESVGGLKDVITQKKKKTFANVDADELQLWQVDVPFTAAQQIETAKLAQNKKLSAVKKIVNCWDPRPPEDCIHVIIARPPGSETSSKRRETELHQALNALCFEHAIMDNRINLDKLTPQEKAHVIAQLGQSIVVQDPFLEMFMVALKLRQLKDDKKEEPGSHDIIGREDGRELPVLGMPQLFVRPVYKTLYNIIFGSSTRQKIHLAGTSGIGKSCFLVYIAVRFLSESTDTNPKIIIYEQNQQPSARCYCFAGTKAARRGMLEDFADFLFLPDTLYLADGIVDPAICTAKSIVALSPNNLRNIRDKRFHTFAKTCVSYYMPPWDKIELEICRKMLFADLPADLMTRLFEKAGGVPRYILSAATTEWRNAENKQDYNIIDEKALERFYQAFKEVGNAIELLQCLCEEAHFKKYSNRLIHVWNHDEGFRNPSYDFATSYVFQRLQKNVNEETARHVLYQLADQSFRKSTHWGKLFELYALYLFRKGGLKFNVRKLKGPGNTTLTTPKDETLSIPTRPNIQHFKKLIIPPGSSDELFIPLVDNYPAVDFILTPDKLFQVTTNEDHPVKKTALSEIIKTMKASNPSISEFMLYFVVPEDKYDTYPSQDYKNTNDSTGPNLTPELHMTQQWGLKVDIAAIHKKGKQ